MYKQKTCYNLQRDGYTLFEKKIEINGIHKKENKVMASKVHVWRCLNKKQRKFYDKLGWIEVPAEFIHTRQEQRLSSNYFQTDDMYYSETVRFIPKSQLNKVIEFISKSLTNV